MKTPKGGMDGTIGGFQDILGKSDPAVTPKLLESLHPSLLAALRSPEVVRVIAAPKSRSLRETCYSLENRELAPGQSIIVLTAETHGILRDVVLGHRKDQKYWNLAPGQSATSYDGAGAYSRVQVFDDAKGSFRDWKDPAGYDPVKFAERRADTEIENLHDWPYAVGSVSPRAVRITSVGPDPKLSIVTEVSLDVVTYPAPSPSLQTKQRVFTPGTSFPDYGKATYVPPTYGGGEKVGAYPQAVPLRSAHGNEPFPMTKQLNDSEAKLDASGRVHVALQPGRRVQCVEVIVGDTWFNYGGGGTTLGWAKLNVVLRTKQGTELRCITNANIPPQGTLAGGPPDASYVTAEGDELIISSTTTSYLMGYRVTYDAPGKAGVGEQLHDMLSPVQPGHAPKPDTVVKPGVPTGAPGTMKEPSLPSPKLVPTGAVADAQGGRWCTDTLTGKQYVVRDYQGNPDRSATEFIAMRLYRILGLPVGDIRLHEGKILSRKLDGVTVYSGSKDDVAEITKRFVHPDVLRGFVADAWLANWDVLGLHYENMVRAGDGHMLRMRGGGSLLYRANGEPKPSFMSPKVDEIHTMRDPKKAAQAARVFQGVTDKMIREQVAELVKRATDPVILEIVIASGIKDPKPVVAALVARRNWLAKTYA